MCCKTSVLLPEDAGISLEDDKRLRQMLLDIGFEEESYRFLLRLPAPPPKHEFEIPAERLVHVRFEPKAVRIAIQPFIYSHSLEDHGVAALAGSIVFKVADMIGQHLQARVMQEYLLGECLIESGNEQVLLLADYAKGHHMEYKHVCVGFQHAFAKGVPLEEVSLVRG